MRYVIPKWWLRYVFPRWWQVSAQSPYGPLCTSMLISIWTSVWVHKAMNEICKLDTSICVTRARYDPAHDMSMEYATSYFFHIFILISHFVHTLEFERAPGAQKRILPQPPQLSQTTNSPSGTRAHINHISKWKTSRDLTNDNERLVQMFASHARASRYWNKFGGEGTCPATCPTTPDPRPTDRPKPGTQGPNGEKTQRTNPS